MILPYIPANRSFRFILHGNGFPGDFLPAEILPKPAQAVFFFSGKRVNGIQTQSRSSLSGRLGELARLFLRLGTTAFGGPAAHISMLNDEVVTRRRWLSDTQFLDLLGATNLIPGPNSTEMAIHVGYLRAGWPGLIVAGACFILPARLMVLGLSWAYFHFKTAPQTQWILYGIKPVMVVVIIQALWMLGKKAIHSIAVSLVSLFLSFLKLARFYMAVATCFWRFYKLSSSANMVG